jgi:hypothetical protein
MQDYDRAEIQRMLTKAILETLQDNGVIATPEHVRRTIRAVLRIGAKMVLENGGGVEDYVVFAQEALVKEAGPESLMPVDFVAVPVAKGQA